MKMQKQPEESPRKQQINSVAYHVHILHIKKGTWKHKNVYSFRKAEHSCKHTIIIQLHKKQNKETIDQKEMNSHFG